MDEIEQLVSAALADFRKVAALADTTFSVDSIILEITRSPHQPPKGLPAGKMAVYAFFLNGRTPKIEKAGPRSNARYSSQHYNTKSAVSNLARSTLANTVKVGAIGADGSGISDWIKGHTDRVKLLTLPSFGDPMLSLLESFLHVRLKPMFEGGASDV